MRDDEIRKMIKEEVSRQVNVLLHGETGATTEQIEEIQNLYPGMTGIPGRPVMHPFGFVSRAVQGTISVIGRIGEHIGARFVLGHRDKARPTDIEEGETIVYSKGTYRLKIANGAIYVSKGTDYEPVVVGETLRQFLINFIQIFVEHEHIGNLGYETSPPINLQEAVELQAENLDNKKILAQDGGRF